MKKDIEWLKGRINAFQEGENMFTAEFNAGVQDALEYVQELIDQLDEPEVLSQEFINEKVVEVYADTADAEVHAVFRMRDLQNLLVPEQGKVEEGRVRLIVGFDGGTESYYATDIGDALDFLTDYDARFTVSKEPVIPNHIAKWISVHHEQFDLYPALRRLEQLNTRDRDVYKWYRENTHTFVNAYLTGKYEVEEEQKYIVRLPSSMQDAFPIVALGRINKVNLSVRKNRVGTNLTLHDKYLLTEQEIKGYDERFWPFAVKVEELEE